MRGAVSVGLQHERCLRCIRGAGGLCAQQRVGLALSPGQTALSMYAPALSPVSNIT